MKFACPKCNTRYSISDDKVPPGKVLKFPCKTCGNVVRLRRKEGGDQAQILEAGSAAAALAARGFDPVETTRIASVAEINKLRDQSTQPTKVGMQAAHRPDVTFADDGGDATRVVSVEQINLLRAAAAEGDEVIQEAEETRPPQGDSSGEPSEWFVLIAGKQRGPMTASSVDGMLSRNEIDRRTFLWKSGMANWERLGSVERFAGSTSPLVTAEPSAAASTRADPSVTESAMERAAAQSAATNTTSRRSTDDVTVTDLEEVSSGIFEEATVATLNGETATPAAMAAGSEDITLADEAPQGFYKAETMVISDPRVAETAAAALAGHSPQAADARRAETVQLQDGIELLDDRPKRPTDEFMGATTLGQQEHATEHELGSFDDVSGQQPFLDETSGLNQLADDPNYLDKPPGDSTRVYMATAGIYKKRRNNRIAAVITTVVLLLICGFIVMDMRGLIVLPGMGAIYDVAGVEDPNVDRALERTENKLAAEDLDPKKRAQLESLRRKLLDRSNGSESGKSEKPEKQEAKTNGDAKDPAEAKPPEGATDAPQQPEEHAMAEQIFNDKDKQETNVKLAAPDSMQTPNLPDGLTQEAIYKVVNDNNTSMKLCYAEAARKGEKLAGKMEVQLTIDPSGDVTGADINTAQFKTSAMGQCTVRRVKTWKFPKYNGQPVTVVFPYVLQSAF